MKKQNKKLLGFTQEEQAAMKNRAQELLNEGKTDGERDVLAKIEQMSPPERAIAKKLHEIIKKNAPILKPKTWYGMPSYANKDGKVVCYFRSADKFKERYSMLGFNDPSKLDEGNMWSVAYAITKLTTTEEAQIAALVKKAAGL